MRDGCLGEVLVRTIFVWPWNENARRKEDQQTNAKYKAILLVYRTDTNARGFWLVKRTLGWKNFMPENFLEINRYFALTSYYNTIGQSNNAFSILGFLWRENKEAMFWSFHRLADETNKEHLPKLYFKVIRKSLYKALAGKSLVFWISGCLWSMGRRLREVVAFEGRSCSLSLFKCHVFGY